MRHNPQPLSSQARITLLTLAALVLLLVPPAAGATASPVQAAASPFGSLAEQGPLGARPFVEAAPHIEAPANQRSPAGTRITPLVVKGTQMATIKASGLPAGLTLVEKTESEAEIEGTPTAEGEVAKVILEAQNKEKEPFTVEFEWTVLEPLPTIVKPPNQHSTVATAISGLVIEGTRMASLHAAELPAGLKLIEKTETEAEIVGTPTAPGKSKVTLSAQNKEGEPPFSAQFEWTVAEAPPAIEKAPADQTSTEGLPITPVIVKGANLATLKAVGLPAGLELLPKGSGESEWEIAGTPTTPVKEATVTLEALNKEGTAGPTVSFKWTVLEAQPTIVAPADQSTAAGAPIAPVAISGTHLAALSAKGLPAGLELSERSETEWLIAGTPTAPKAASEVVLEAHNKEGRSSAVRVFLWTVVSVGPAPSGTLAISPAVVFSASRAECAGVTWPATAVATQWLLDDVPIAGATASTYVPPRGEDGHRLSCRQTATSAEGATTTVASAEHVIYEQPAQPTWPIAPATQRCRAAVCMIDGGTSAVQSAESYAQGGQWLVARQVRCVSAPWTSQAGDSAVAAVHRLAVAHSIAVSLQRVTAAGAVTILSVQTGELPEAAISGPFGGSLAVPSGAQAFTAGELWTRLQASATGSPNWFAAGQGALFYSTGGSPGIVRSFQLVYNLAPADLGARLRCVASAEDGPAGSPTQSLFASPEYPVSSSSSCAPRRLAAANTTQPALVEPGRAPCLSAPAGPGALEGNQAAVAVAKGRAVIALACALGSGCRGTLSMSAGSVSVGSGTIVLGRGRSAIAHLRLTARGRRLLARATAGVAVTLKLKARAGSRTLGTARLLNVG